MRTPGGIGKSRNACTRRDLERLHLIAADIENVAIASARRTPFSEAAAADNTVAAPAAMRYILYML